MVKQCATLGDLKQELKDAGDKLVVIDFYATWCGPCKVIAPKVEEMSSSMSNVVFLKVDVDENEDAAGEYNISAMPTFILGNVFSLVLSTVFLPNSWRMRVPVLRINLLLLLFSFPNLISLLTFIWMSKWLLFFNKVDGFYFTARI